MAETLPPTGAGDVQADAIARALVDAAGWGDTFTPAADGAGFGRVGGAVTLVGREVLVDDVVHTTFEVVLGPGPYETIRLHRVVAERSDGRPIRARESLFMLHGGGVGFEGSYLAQASDPADRSLPAYLASNGIDVWGIDLGWILVPQDVTDFGFFADWGLQRDVDDLAAGLAIARRTRIHTQSGPAPFHLLSWSAGVIKAYVHAAQEAGEPAAFRDVKTLIPVDGTALLADDPGSCELVAQLEALLAAGEVVDTTGVLAVTVSQLARFDPDGFSPVPGLESFTNLQVLLFAQTLTDQFLGGGTSTFHLFAGEFDAFGFPTGLRYVPTQTGIEFYGSWAPYAPNRVELEGRQYDCASAPAAVPADFSSMELPVLYVAPNGGYGTAAVASNEAALGSEVFRTLVVTTGNPALLDIGHVDLFKAEASRELFWQPVLEWIREFAEPGRSNRPFFAAD